jgi:MFS transporter, putative metabolite:H+ symporter
MLFGSVISDRFSRKTILLIGVIISTLFTLVLPLAATPRQLIAMRLLAGVGFGLALPAAYPLGAELLPAKHRRTFGCVYEIVLAFAFTTIPLFGYLAGDSLSAWKTVPLPGGLMLFIVPPLVYFFIPESPRLYMMRGQFGLAVREANKIILRSGARIAPLSVDAEARSSPLRASLPPYFAVFGPNQIRATLVATLTWLSALVSYYLFSFMLPKALVDQGYAVQLSFGLSTLLFLVAIPGRILNAYMMERLGRRLTIFVALSSSVVGLFLMVIAHSLAGTTFGVAAPTLTFTIGVVIAGLTVLSCFPAVRMYMTEQFPTNIRGRGYFLSEMTGRAVAGIAIPYLMAGYTASPTIFFGTVLVFAIVGAVVPVLFGRETRGQLELVTATDRCSAAAEAAIRSDATASSSAGWSKSRTCG